MTNPFRFRFQPTILLLCALLLHGCGQAPLRGADPAQTVPAYTFRFADGGEAFYFVLDKGAFSAAPSPHAPHAPLAPQTFVFVIGGSGCINMQPLLPEYFDGLGDSAASGRIRIFLLQKRFIGSRNSSRAEAPAPAIPFIRAANAARCSDAFIDADHPSRWLADQSEFIAAQLSMARADGRLPQRIAVVGISEGGEVAPLLARHFAAVTHVAILANGGMDPIDVFRLQSVKSGLPNDPQKLERICSSLVAASIASQSGADARRFGGRSCRYWSELRGIRHTDNLLALRIPLFMAIGEADQFVPIESAWFIRDRMGPRAENQRAGLRLVTYPGADHGFKAGNTSLMPSVWSALDRWLQE